MEQEYMKFSQTVRNDGAVLYNIEFNDDAFTHMASAERKAAAIQLMYAAIRLVEAS
jgi:hypothetical protein